MARPATVATAATKFLQITISVSKTVYPIILAAWARAPFLPLLAASAVQAMLTLQGSALLEYSFALVGFDHAKPDSRRYPLTKSWEYGLGIALMPEIMD
ncbi:uncharacterized protein BBA_04904 [Beauveria bassiana ARSEF 2860]|uniref:Uncharacterized protein n=1 Tax=Beauveria bassiana (strain ARSEF 2860) TaxID=655819 RepID=J5JKI1_BEAB2|nr:uncharacterized protein BBA_04904 [Beauveria bassiana ARSEF 2860]EJP65933.1 hypothetical protein BBA_04904 [Beauveria bassiana ARSEF 2860]